MIARNWLLTGIAARLGQSCIQVTLVTPHPLDRAAAKAAGLDWRPLLRIGGSRFLTRWRLAAGYFLHLALVFRFNAIQEFRGASLRLRQNRHLRRLALKDGVPAFSLFGWPFPKSHWLFKRLSGLHAARWQRFGEVERLFDELKPDLLVLGHVQNHFPMPYALAASARNIPILGMIGSWDQPTTKGPLLPGIARLLAQSRAVESQLIEHHGVSQDRIEVVGWPQTDLFVRGGQVPARAEILASLQLDRDRRYVLMGASPERLGHNEPQIATDLATALAEHDCALVIRVHPNDRTWRERFLPLHRPPYVVVLPPELGDMQRMAAQIRNAAVLLSPAGSILLDAIALDTPAIALAFENEDEPYHDRLARRYEMEHWAEIVASGGISLARSNRELEALVISALSDRSSDANARAFVRGKFLEPMDGCVADRIVAAITRTASV